MCFTRRYPDPCGSRRAGFTLMELLVALMISGILVTVIFQLLQGNSMFVRRQSAREEVQQNARASLSLLTGDLRGVPPGGIAAMDTDSIRFYLPRAWGVLCNTVEPTTETAWVLFPAGVVPDADFWNKPQWGIAVEQTTSVVNHTGVFRFVAGTSKSTAAHPCASIEPALTTQHLPLGFVRPSGSAFVAADSAPAGTQVMLFEEMKYDVAAASSGMITGKWIRRMLGYGEGGAPNMQPMAGPLPESGGLRFTYFGADGVTTTTTPSQVRQIQIRVITQSRAREGDGSTPQQVDTLQTEVFLRNTPG